MDYYLNDYFHIHPSIYLIALLSHSVIQVSVVLLGIGFPFEVYFACYNFTFFSCDLQ